MHSYDYLSQNLEQHIYTYWTPLDSIVIYIGHFLTLLQFDMIIAPPGGYMLDLMPQIVFHYPILQHTMMYKLFSVWFQPAKA